MEYACRPKLLLAVFSLEMSRRLATCLCTNLAAVPFLVVHVGIYWGCFFLKYLPVSLLYSVAHLAHLIILMRPHCWIISMVQ